MRSIRPLPLLFACLPVCLPACLLASCAAKAPRPESHAAAGTVLSGSLDGWVQRGGKAFALQLQRDGATLFVPLRLG